MRNITYQKHNRFPTDSLLENYIPISFWRRLNRIALSAPLRRNGNATLVFNEYGEELAWGVSRMAERTPHDALGLHAERMALESIPTWLSEGSTVVNWAVDLCTRKVCWNAAPCSSCVRYLHTKKVGRVIYPKFDVDAGQWTVVDTTTEALVKLLKPATGMYARDMRVGVLN